MLLKLWIVNHSSGNGYSIRYVNDMATSVPCHCFATLYALLSAMSHHSVPLVDMTLESYND